GGLFEQPIIIPQFTEQARAILLEAASFDWRDISPTIFGAVFESTLNPDTRRAGGMHYTSIENIHKVIDPLFLDALEDELDEIAGQRNKSAKTRFEWSAGLAAYRQKLASLRIFDPACGSGNFLTETYLRLRELENRVLQHIHGEQLAIGEFDPIQVSIKQFYGIEINDFAVEVAKTALWIAELQMLAQTRQILANAPFEPLPLKDNANIHCANALRMDWNEVLPASECSYIIGNPPFYGARMQSKEQKAELIAVFGGARNSGNVDYVSGWFVKAADYIADEPVRCAFVATNSICQGEQVANVWHPLHQRGVHIDFAHTTFRWRNEALEQAHVFVVIVGFSKQDTEKTLFHYANPDAAAETKKPARINAYLADAPDVFVWSRNTPICAVPAIGVGNQPIDNGNYLFKAEEKADFLAREPAAAKYFHPWLGADEFIKGKRRWVLWLGDATEQELAELPLCRERIENVRQYRLASKRPATVKLAQTPARFAFENMSESTSILIPKVSSERRKYIPLGFIEPDTLCSDLVFLAANASLYHFGVLHSQFHNAWVRTVCGRLKSDYRYSGSVVYNNFIWPQANDAQKQHIEQCAQAVLDARAAHPGATLAQLYDPDKMPANLRDAHHALDAAVEAAYGVNFEGDEEKIVAHLFQLYAQATASKGK
ncbi:MAG: class I SAM-dependent DNA methyltransferase, partial [Ottowia sp.]|nr:class I SAM-dependent DNA methyltransferase [Ottowia sp.]